MKHRILYILFCLVSCLSAGTAQAQRHTFTSASVLSKGRFVKVRVTESGVYRLPYSALQSKGIDPANVRLFGYGGAMLDEDFSQPKYDDLPEVAVWDTGDAILFYAQGVNSWAYDSSAKKFIHTLNPYSLYGYYFITSDNVGEKKRIASQTPIDAAAEEITVFTDCAVHEKEQKTIISSGRKMYEEIHSGGKVNASFDFPGLVTDSEVEVRTSVARNGTFQLQLNGGSARNVSVTRHTDLTFQSNSEHLSFALSYSGTGQGYVDYIEVNAVRRLSMTGAYMVMRNRRLAYYNRYVLQASTPASVRVWDVNDPVDVREMPVERTGSSLAFVDKASVPKTYVAVDMDAVAVFPTATLLDEVPRQNLHGMASADMLIIAHPWFVGAAQALADAHGAQDGLSVSVATAEQIYNEFSSGTPDASAYRWAAKMLHERDDRPLRYLLLFGKGSFDNRGLLAGSGNPMLLTFQSYNSVADDKESYVTDDYFGYLDDHEGRSLGNGDKLDIGIGRFPVATEEQAWDVVEKTIRYIRNETPGAWKNQLCFLGDDGDSNNHMAQADGVADTLATYHPSYNIHKIMLDAYQQEVNASGQTYPLAKNRFNNLIRSGVLYINYMGHANMNGWTNEQMLSNREIQEMTNRYLPLFAAGTCEFSRFDREYVSGGESLVLNAQGGGIGTFSATRSVYPNWNYPLIKSFATHLFGYADRPGMTVGDAVREAKNATGTSFSASNNLTYVYFGDPAVRLNYPNRYQVEAVELNGTPINGTDTLRALAETTLKGIVTDPLTGSKADTFDGMAQVVVLDKEERVTTLNNDGEDIASFTFRDRPNTIFKGTVEVRDGEFDITFMQPKDIKYNYGTGRMVFTVWDDAGTAGGQGFTENFIVGGSNPAADGSVSEGPQVEMYLNFPGFVSGGQVHEAPVFTARVSDPNGVNISSPTPGHDMMLVLDDNRSFVLNDYYESDPGTYKAGTVSYQLPELEAGHYTLMFRVWNLYNVSTVEYLDFEVVPGLSPEVLSVSCYPNPATSETTIRVKHDREGELISMTLDVFALSGQHLWSVTEQRTDAITWDLHAGGHRLSPGVYLYRVSVKTEDKITSYRANKLIVR